MRLINIFFACSIFLCAACSPGPAQVRGSVFLDLKNGDALVLKGLELHLCKPELVDTLKSHPKVQSVIQGGECSAEDETDAVIALVEASKAASLQAVSTDVDGKFSFDEVEPGKYCLFAQKEMNRPSLLLVAWVLPIEIKPGQKLKQDLNGSNELGLVAVPGTNLK